MRAKLEFPMCVCDKCQSLLDGKVVVVAEGRVTKRDTPLSRMARDDSIKRMNLEKDYLKAHEIEIEGMTPMLVGDTLTHMCTVGIRFAYCRRCWKKVKATELRLDELTPGEKRTKGFWEFVLVCASLSIFVAILSGRLGILWFGIPSWLVAVWYLYELVSRR